MLEVIICGNDSLPLSTPYTQANKCRNPTHRNLNYQISINLAWFASNFFPRLKTHNIK